MCFRPLRWSEKDVLKMCHWMLTTIFFSYHSKNISNDHNDYSTIYQSKKKKTQNEKWNTHKSFVPTYISVPHTHIWKAAAFGFWSTRLGFILMSFALMLITSANFTRSCHQSQWNVNVCPCVNVIHDINSIIYRITVHIHIRSVVKDFAHLQISHPLSDSGSCFISFFSYHTHRHTRIDCHTRKAHKSPDRHRHEHISSGYGCQRCCLSIAHDIKRMCQVQTIQTQYEIQTCHTEEKKSTQNVRKQNDTALEHTSTRAYACSIEKNTHIIWLTRNDGRIWFFCLDLLDVFVCEWDHYDHPELHFIIYRKKKQTGTHTHPKLLQINRNIMF